jgi:hypothetical protein
VYNVILPANDSCQSQLLLNWEPVGVGSTMFCNVMAGSGLWWQIKERVLSLVDLVALLSFVVSGLVVDSSCRWNVLLDMVETVDWTFWGVLGVARGVSKCIVIEVYFCLCVEVMVEILLEDFENSSSASYLLQVQISLYVCVPVTTL